MPKEGFETLLSNDSDSDCDSDSVINFEYFDCVGCVGCAHCDCDCDR